MSNNIVSTLVKLAIGSLLLGLLLSAFSISPRELLKDLGGTVQSIFEAVASMIEWSVEYILLGAVVVVPIWLIFFVWGKFRGK
jgi:hypothetical protein